MHLGGRWPTLLDGEPRTAGALREGSQLQVGAVLLSVARLSMTAPPGGPATEDEEPPLAPDTVLAERYRIHDLVGRGGMGAVYRAEHLALGNPVAVKVLRASHGAHDDMVRRFQREAVAASQIRHPGIVEVTDFGRTPDGRSTSRWSWSRARRWHDGCGLGPFPPTEAMSLVRELARALGAAHARGIYHQRHRDIKPENVLLARDGSAKIAHFGIARSQRARAMRGRPPPESSSERRTTCRPSRPPGSARTAAATSTPWEFCSSSCSPARRPTWEPAPPTSSPRISSPVPRLPGQGRMAPSPRPWPTSWDG